MMEILCLVVLYLHTHLDKPSNNVEIKQEDPAYYEVLDLMFDQEYAKAAKQADEIINQKGDHQDLECISQYCQIMNYYAHDRKRKAGMLAKDFKVNVSDYALAKEMNEQLEIVRKAYDDLYGEDTSVNETAPVVTKKPQSVVTPKPRSTSKTKRKYVEEDDYDISEYSNPDDFYDDNYDNFFDYEDAEDYWYDHGGD